MPTTALCRTGEDGWAPVEDLDEVMRLRRDPAAMVWIEGDVSGMTDEQVRELARGFELDPLAIEDALSPRQRPKLEAYPHHQLLVVHQLDEDEDDQLVPRQLAAFVGEGFAVVLHHAADRLVAEARRRVQGSDRRPDPSGDRLMHLIVDAAVDDDEAHATRVSEEIEDLEAEALGTARSRERRDAPSAARAPLPSQFHLYTLKQQLSTLRRYAVPVGAALERRHSSDGSRGASGDGEVERLFRDVHDHVVRLAAQVRGSNELIDGVIELARALQGDQLNEINKKLTGWAAVVAASALIAGLYGVNYRLLPPLALGRWGFAYVAALMLATSGAVYLFFKRRGWL